MLKEAVFTMKLEPELRDAFMAEADATHRPASQIVRELMRDFVQRQREAREYDAFLRDKVEAARASMQVGEGRPDEEVEARFAARREADERSKQTRWSEWKSWSVPDFQCPRVRRLQRRSYQTPRPLPCWLRVPRSTSARKCCFRVLRLAPVSLMASPIVTRPCSRANSTI